MKKAQVTIFIILGIIILIALGFGIYLATQTIIKPKIPTAENIAKNYIEDCIKQTATTALKKIGDNAGYLDFENEYRTFDIKTEPAEGDALIISEIGFYPITYWWYMKTQNKCNNCYLTTDNIPLLPEIEEQINNYVAQNIDNCLSRLSQFQHAKIEAGALKPETFITKDNIKITAEYPIEIILAGTKTKLKDFEAQIDVKFRQIYELANEIIQIQKENAVIENRIMHMLSAHMGADHNKIPPISEITHDYYLVSWVKQMIEISIKQILNSYAPLLRFYGTKNTQEINTENRYARGFYNAMKIEDLKKKYPLSVDISYNDWPIYFDIKPDTLTGTSHKQNFPYDIMPAFQTNTYEFYYDLSVPLLVQIRDEEAFKGQGYTLNFAIEANIRDNKDFTEWNQGEGTIGQWNAEQAGFKTSITERRQGECTQITNKYQCSLNNKKYDTLKQCIETCYTTKEKTQKPTFVRTEFCSSQQRLSGKIKITASSQEKPVENAGISYACGNYKTCSIGTTNKNGTAEFRLPICYGGILSVHKPEHFIQKILLNTEADKEETLQIELIKEKEFTIDFKKKTIQTEQTKQGPKPQCCGITTKPETTQKAMLSLERMPTNPGEAQYVQAIMIENEATLKLVPGKYKTTIQYLDEQGIVIPKECKQVCIKEKQEDAIKACNLACGQHKETAQQNCKIIFPLQPEWCEDADFALTQCEKQCTKTECAEWMKIPEENIYIKPALLGGAIMNENTGYWEVSQADINSNLNHITFYVLEIPTPNCLDTDCRYPQCTGLEEIGKTEEYSKQFRQEIEPGFT